MAEYSVPALRAVTATEAKTHFGRLLESSQHAPVVVERQGKPVAVVMSAEQYDLLTGRTAPAWRDMAARSRELVRDAMAGSSLPPVSDTIETTRLERDDDHDRLR